MAETRQDGMVVPRLMVLLGTDASGKNHVARLWAARLRADRVVLEVREGKLSTPPAVDRDHGDKGTLSLLAERVFLLFFPLARLVLPLALPLLLWWDLRRYRSAPTPVLVVSHSVLRLLAFCLGQNAHYLSDGRLNGLTARGLRRMAALPGLRVFVLDVDDTVRRARLQARLAEGSMDPFDQYMAADSVRSERIEACLVRLAQDAFGAHLIENNNLSDADLWAAFEAGCAAPASGRP